jgi:hypothetical protein
VQATGLDSSSERARPVGLNAKKTALIIAASLVSINIWTGAPLFALWVGSLAVASPGLTMGAFGLILIVLAVVEFLLAVLLVRLNAAHDELTGRPAEARQSSPWLRSMRGERERLRRARYPTSPIEKAVMLTVVVAVLALEIWFFFFAHYVYPHSTVGGI